MWKTVETNCLKWNVKGLKGNWTTYYFKGLHSQGFCSFHVLMWTSPSLLLLVFFTHSVLATQRLKEIANIWLLVSPQLCSLFSRDHCSERLERSWALCPEQLSADYWQLVRDFPRRHSFSLKRHIYSTHRLHFRLQTEQARVFYSYV